MSTQFNNFMLSIIITSSVTGKIHCFARKFNHLHKYTSIFKHLHKYKSIFKHVHKYTSIFNDYTDSNCKRTVPSHPTYFKTNAEVVRKHIFQCFILCKIENAKLLLEYKF